MKKLALVFVLGSLLAGSSAFAAACTADDVKLAQDFFDLTTRRFNAGQVAGTDVNIVQGALLEMQYCAGTLAKADYCAKILPIAREMIDLEQTASERGMSTTTEFTASLERLARLRVLCAK